MDQRIGVVGLGYVGVTTACCLASFGHTVTGVDIDGYRVELLNSGKAPIFEDGLEELLAEGLAGERLSFSTDQSVLEHAHVVFLCLPTPEGASGSPDTSILRSAFEDLAPLLPIGCIVVTKSTVPIGTAGAMRTWTDRDDLRFVSNPEFLREGSAIADFLRPDRIVVGTNDTEATRTIEQLLAPADAEFIHCDPLSAELIKYASNAFLATKLSFTNELARICDELGGNIDAVTHGLGTDHRIAASFLRPGPGWGGSCFPKDVAGLASLARDSRLRVPVIESAAESNRDHLDHVVGRIVDMLTGVTEPRVAVWGLAFKANTDDVRSSPALEIIERLQARQVSVCAHDPVAVADSAIEQSDLLGACADADLLVVVTEWGVFGEADLARVASVMRRPAIFDLRAVIDPAAADAAGCTLVRLGHR
jgi:UDPglucose 6-dehydrogenase